MWEAYSFVLRKLITADECNYSDTTRLQIRCPYCRQPVMLRKGDYISSYFAHYSTQRTYTLGGLNQKDCPNRVESEGCYSAPIEEFFNPHNQGLITQFAYFSQFFDEFIHYSYIQGFIDESIVTMMKQQILDRSLKGDPIARELRFPKMKEFYDLTLSHFLKKGNVTLLRWYSRIKIEHGVVLPSWTELYIECLSQLSECYRSERFDFSSEGEKYQLALSAANTELVPCEHINKLYKELRFHFTEVEALCILGLFYQPSNVILNENLQNAVTYARQLLDIYGSINVNKILSRFKGEILVRNVRFNLMFLKKSKRLKDIDTSELNKEELDFIRKCISLPYGKNVLVSKVESASFKELNELNITKILKYLQKSGRNIKIVYEAKLVAPHVLIHKETPALQKEEIESTLKQKNTASKIDAKRTWSKHAEQAHCPYCKLKIKVTRLEKHINFHCPKAPCRRLKVKEHPNICLTCKCNSDGICKATEEPVTYRVTCVFCD